MIHTRTNTLEIEEDGDFIYLELYRVNGEKKLRIVYFEDDEYEYGERGQREVPVSLPQLKALVSAAEVLLAPDPPFSGVLSELQKGNPLSKGT